MARWQGIGGRLSNPLARLVIAGMMVVALAVVGIAGLYEFRADDLRQERVQRQSDTLRPRVAAVLAILGDPSQAERLPAQVADLRRWGDSAGAGLPRRLPSYETFLRDLDTLAVLGALRQGDPRQAPVLMAAARLMTELDGLDAVLVAEREAARERLVRLVSACLIGLIIVAGLGIVPLARGLLRRGGALLGPAGPDGRGLDHNYAAAFEAMGDGVAIFDAQDRLLYCNTAFRDVYQVADDPIPEDA